MWVFQLYCKHISQHSLNKYNWWNEMHFTSPHTAVYWQITIIYLLHNITIHALRSQKFASFSAFIKPYIYIYTYIYVLFYSKTDGIVSAVEASQYFIPSLTTKFPVLKHNSYGLTIDFITVCSTVTDPVWRVLLAVSVWQFGLSVCLNQVRYRPCTSNGKMSPFPPCSPLC